MQNSDVYGKDGQSVEKIVQEDTNKKTDHRAPCQQSKLPQSSCYFRFQNQDQQGATTETNNTQNDKKIRNHFA